MKTTISVIEESNVGSVAGHAKTHVALLNKCDELLAKAKNEFLLVDYHITSCGDDIDLIMTHRNGEENEEVYELAFNAFVKELRLQKV